MGITIFLKCFHVEFEFQASNRLNQFLERRSVRASRGLSQCNDLNDARTLRRLRNWLRNRATNEPQNRYLLWHEECIFQSYKIKSDNGGITRGRQDRASVSEAEWSLLVDPPASTVSKPSNMHDMHHPVLHYWQWGTVPHPNPNPCA
jgi:hypothetical protein